MADRKWYVRDKNTGELIALKLVDPGDGSGYSLANSVVSSSTGGATSAKQDTGNTSLASIDTKLPSKGSAVAANSIPVVLSSDGPFATNFGVQADTEATTDTGSFSFISFVKRLLNTKLKIGQQTKAASLAVTPASDWTLPKADSLEVTGSAGILNADAIASTDISPYAWFSVQILGTWSGTLTFQTSNDNTNWVSTLVYSSASTGAVATTIATTNNIFTGPRTGKFFRVRMTSYVSGTANVTAEFFVLPVQLLGTGVAASVFGTATPAETFTNPTATVQSQGFPEVFNGTNWDRQRGMTTNIVLASAARTATISTDVINYNGRTMAVILNITAAPNTASTITLQIRYKDSISGNYIVLLASAAIVGSASQTPPYTNAYRVGQGITVTANVSASDVLGRTMNVNVVHSNSDSWTYSISTDIGV